MVGSAMVSMSSSNFPDLMISLYTSISSIFYPNNALSASSTLRTGWT